MKIGLISDTHNFLDDKVWEYFKECDEIWHAGDIGELDLIQKLEQFKPVKAVFGNIDAKPLRLLYPEYQIFECENLKIMMTHIGGSPPNYNPKVLKKIQEIRPDIFICGHSHILKVMQDKTNELLYLNAGAAGHHGFHVWRTLLRFDIADKKVSAMEVIQLGKRGQIHKILSE